MRLPIIVSRLSNFLFFIQRSVKCGLGDFDLGEYLADQNLELAFLGKNENKIWSQVKKTVGARKAEQFRKIIVSFAPAFNSRWRGESQNLLAWQKYFQENHSQSFKRVISDIKKLSGAKHLKISDIPVYLISDITHQDKEICAWFSWEPKKRFIVVEIPSRLRVPGSLFPASILAHEFFHLALRENKNLFLEINKIAERNKGKLAELSGGMPVRMFLEELVISSFIPEGYLGKKHFLSKIAVYNKKSNNLLEWRKFVAYKLNNTAKEYTDNACWIDRKYLENLLEVILE